MSTGVVSPAESAAPVSGGQVARAIDRWLFVFMAAWFIAIVLVGFLPDSAMKIAAVDAGKRAEFPFILHVHAAVMGAFLLFLLSQATLVATGRRALHRQFGVAGAVLAVALVVVGFLLVPTIYHQIYDAIPSAPVAAQEGMRRALRSLDNTMLLQIRAGLLFSVFVTIALLARKSNPGLHKRMMVLAVVVPLGAAFARMTWLPTSMPEDPLSLELFMLVAASPMFAWDVIRQRKIHLAYLVWLAGFVPATIAVHALWNNEGWRAIAHQLVGAA